MKSLFGPEGRAALAAMAAAERPLLAFDFDGTLAPIVSRPADAAVPLPVARRLAEVARCWPVAVVSGRSVADLRQRLGFEPRYFLGNHGAENATGPPEQQWVTQLDPLRAILRAAQPQLSACGVTVEDKLLSIALHYRLAPDAAVARTAIDAVLRDADRSLSIGSGKCVVNVVAGNAPDKGDALLSLAESCRADAGLFIGDDENDEPAFAKLPSRWVTARMGPDTVRSKAMYCLDGPSQVPILLQTLLDLHRAR